MTRRQGKGDYRGGSTVLSASGWGFGGYAGKGKKKKNKKRRKRKGTGRFDPRQALFIR
jgi:hypothetical protein